MSGKLKGIYDALDHGQYKNACKLCAGFLQKSPQHSLVRALHAVALERCGRRDEAIRLCQETVAAGIASDKNSLAAMDDTCLSTLQVVLRRCRQWPAVLKMYEAAWNKEPEVEEYGVVLFLVSVHSHDFGKAQQVATKLYQKYKKSQFLQWVIAAILLQVRAGAPLKALDLAAMMLQKAPVDLAALSKDKVSFNRGQIYLFFLHLGTLQLQQKQAEALKLLEDCRALLKLPSDVYALRAQLLWEADQKKEAVLEARDRLMASPGNWAQAQDFARMVFELPAPEGVEARGRLEVPVVTSMEDVETHRTDDEVRNALLLFRYLQQVQEQGEATGGGSGVNRVAVLAELELRRCALVKAPDDTKVQVEELLKVLLSFIQRFSGRSHCFFDLKPLLCYLSVEDAAPLLSAAGQGREAVVFTARLRRAFRRPGSPGGSQAEVAEARRLVETWQDLGGFDGGPDALLQLAAVALIEADRMSLADPSEATASGRQHLLDAIRLAQMALAQQPHVFGFKVLLLLLYNALDLPHLMMKLYSTMEIKNIQHESLSYLVLDALRSSPEHLQQVCRSIQAFHEDLDKDGGDALTAAFQMQGAVLCRAPEYVDGILEVSRSVMWGRAIVEETALDLSSAGSWENLECRQMRMLQLVAELPSEQWALRNQDRALLNGLQPLPLLRPCDDSVEALGERQTNSSLTSFATSWGSFPCRERLGARARFQATGLGAAEFLLGTSHSPTLSAALLQCAGALTLKEVSLEDMSSSLDLARSELPSIDLAAAAAAAQSAAADGSCWGQAYDAFRTFGHVCSFSACESALLILRAGPEAPENLIKNLEAINSSLGSVLQCLRLGFHPAPRDGSETSAATGATGAYALGGFGCRCLGALNHCLLVLAMVVLWLTTALPKSSKKAKANDALHQSRLALRDTLQFLQRTMGELQTDLQSAAKMDSLVTSETVHAASVFRDVFKGELLQQFQSTEVVPGLLESHRLHLKSLSEIMGQRLTLLKSRPFKP